MFVFRATVSRKNEKLCEYLVTATLKENYSQNYYFKIKKLKGEIFARFLKICIDHGGIDIKKLFTR